MDDNTLVNSSFSAIVNAPIEKIDIARGISRRGGTSRQFRKGEWGRKTFEYGTWGGELRSEFTPLPGEAVAQENWCSSGFADTDLDLLLKRHGVQKLIVIGLIAHTCVEATVRYAAELGYEITVIKDATADYSDGMMHAALEINLPDYANAIVTTSEILQSISLVAGQSGKELRQ